MNDFRTFRRFRKFRTFEECSNVLLLEIEFRTFAYYSKLSNSKRTSGAGQ